MMLINIRHLFSGYQNPGREIPSSGFINLPSLSCRKGKSMRIIRSVLIVLCLPALPLRARAEGLVLEIKIGGPR